MKRNNKLIKITFILLISLFLFSMNSTTVNAISIQDVKNGNASLEDFIKAETGLDINNISAEEILTAYDELTQKYTNEELSNMIEENKEELVSRGVDPGVISTTTNILRTVDAKELKKVLNENANIEEIINKLESGYSLGEAIIEAQEDLSLGQQISIILKLLYTSYIFKIISALVIILMICSIVFRWKIYKKAGRHGWASIIPIYREIVLFKVCGMSPWLLLFLLLPIIGWIMLVIIWIMLKFMLAQSFGKGSLFGFGLLFFGVIFEAIIAFNPNIKYVMEE